MTSEAISLFVSDAALIRHVITHGIPLGDGRSYPGNHRNAIGQRRVGSVGLIALIIFLSLPPWAPFCPSRFSRPNAY